jgi:hypothetical protein
MNQQKESEIIQNMIDKSRAEISQAEREILALQRQQFKSVTGKVGWVDPREVGGMIQAYQQRIGDLEGGITRLEHRLPQVIGMEQIVDNVNANNARAQAEREAQAAAERDAAMRQAAQQRYLNSGGDPAQFEAAWPSIRQQIATQQATQAATAALATPTGIDQARSAVQQALANRYAGHLNVQGGE